MPGLRVHRSVARPATGAMPATERAGAMLGSVQLRRAALAFLSASGIVASGVLGAAVVLVARPQPALAAGCTRAAPSAAAHGASIDALRSPAWTAADLTGSVPLTDGRRLWLYGDTITSGLGPTGGAVSRSFTARNSAIVQERGCLTPLLQGSGPTAGSWIPQLGAEWSWPGDGYARDGTVWVYATRLGEIGPGVFGFEARAVDLVEVDQATLTIRRVHRNRYAAAPVLLGSSVTTDGTWTYVYGRDERGSKRNTYVARVPAANPLATTTYWTGAAWSTDAGQARPIFTTDVVGGPAFDDLGPAYGAKRFVAAVKDGEFLTSSVELYTAPGPAGPWAKVTTVPAAGLADRLGDVDLHGVAPRHRRRHGRPAPDVEHQQLRRGGRGARRARLRRGAPRRAREPPRARRRPGGAGRQRRRDRGRSGPGHPHARGRHAGRPGGSSRLIGGRVVAFPIAGQAGVPAAATSVVATFTVVDPRLSGFLTVFPCGRAMPVASSLNYLAGEVVPNTITASLGTGGAVCVYPQHDLDLVVDVAASIGPGGHGFAGVAPTRLLDTRSGLGGRRLPAGGQIAVAVSGRGGVPAGAVAAAVNVTATEASRAGYVTAWPCDQPRPLASVVNIVPGVTRADNAVVRLSARGEVCLYSQSPTELIVDVSGYYGAGAGGAHQAVVPMRRLDTRNGQGGHGRPGGGQILTLPIAGRDGIPTAARAVRVNLVAVAPSAPTFVTAYPCGRYPPTVSNLNLEPAGAFRANGATVPLDANGQLCLFTLASTDLVLDIEGWVT